MWLVFFFFQAEDGIRDLIVTGVQTCALPISLRRTSYSPNIKERMDASCALFDAEGRMVAQAEHIPVHLGSMPLAVEAALRGFPRALREDDPIILHHPYPGGAHPPGVAPRPPRVFCCRPPRVAGDPGRPAGTGG